MRSRLTARHVRMLAKTIETFSKRHKACEEGSSSLPPPPSAIVVVATLLLILTRRPSSQFVIFSKRQTKSPTLRWEKGLRGNEGGEGEGCCCVEVLLPAASVGASVATRGPNPRRSTLKTLCGGLKTGTASPAGDGSAAEKTNIGKARPLLATESPIVVAASVVLLRQYLPLPSVLAAGVCWRIVAPCLE